MTPLTTLDKWRASPNSRGPIMTNLDGNWWGAIRKEDMLLLKEFIKKHGIKRVVEFGAGLSTIVMDSLCTVLSYETETRFAERVLPALKNSMVVIWDGQFTNIPVNCEFVFIDGPAGGKSREPSYESAAKSNAKFIACHDYLREHETLWQKKWLFDWESLIEGKYTKIYGRVLQPT